MTQLLLQWADEVREGPCGLCARPTTAGPGTQLVVAGVEARAAGALPGRLVCRECGRQHAPSLVALVQLANEAERVGKIGRHTVFPPYTALLDLARAADAYSATVPPPNEER